MAESRKTITVSVLNEEGVVYYGECSSLSVPTQKDVITVLPYHTPLIAKLGEGRVIVRTPHEKQELGIIKKGLIYVGDNEATVLIGL